MTGGAQARLRPSLIPLFSSVLLSRLSYWLKGEKRGLKGRKGTNALYYYGMREATNLPFFCPVCLQNKFFCPVCLQKKFVCPVCFSFTSAVCINDTMD